MYVLTDRRVPWAARRNTDMLDRMAEYFGGTAIEALAARLGIAVDPEAKEKMVPEPIHTLEDAVNEEFRDLVDPDLMDLTRWLLTVDPQVRPSAVQALTHRFLQETE
jgi:serine/threonine protein kinase